MNHPLCFLQQKRDVLGLVVTTVNPKGLWIIDVEKNNKINKFGMFLSYHPFIIIRICVVLRHM